MSDHQNITYSFAYNVYSAYNNIQSYDHQIRSHCSTFSSHATNDYKYRIIVRKHTLRVFQQ